MDQLIQISGALLVLVGYALGQLGRLDTSSRRYLALNLLGSTFLAVDAFTGRNWGFLILNATWAAISLVNLARILWQRSPDHHGGSA